MKTSKLQKEINSIGKCEITTGELFIETEIEAVNYSEFEEKQNLIIENLIIPIGLKISENLIYRKDLKISLSFKWIRK